MERRWVQIENIHIGSRHREPDMAKVREIAKSIADVGLMNLPAIVFRDGIMIDGVEEENVPVLIYGRHRLLAMQELGRVAVECIVHDVDDLHAELMEIDENLARSELSPAQEAAHILRRQVIWGEINSGGTICATRSEKLKSLGPQHQKKFAAEVAEVTGASKADINRKLRRARKLGDDTGKIVNTSLDSGVEMDALIRLPEPERVALIERAAAGERVSARPIAIPAITTATIQSPLVDVIRAADQDAVNGARAALDEFLGRFSLLAEDQRGACLKGRDLSDLFEAYTNDA